MPSPSPHHKGVPSFWTDGRAGLQVNLRVVTAETLRLGVETHVCEVQLILRPIAELKVPQFCALRTACPSTAASRSLQLVSCAAAPPSAAALARRDDLSPPGQGWLIWLGWCSLVDFFSSHCVVAVGVITAHPASALRIKLKSPASLLPYCI
jgi:hypothetical protein